MSGSQFTLQPGVVSTLGPQLAGGTAIVNHDSNHAVWVSALASVQPGYGSRIGPMGSLVWSGTAPCYAVTDTGVSVPVVLNTSSDVSQLSNPVDVGVAVANELAAGQGIAVSNPQAFNFSSAIAGSIAQEQLSLVPGQSVSVGNAVDIGNAVGAQSLTLAAGTTGAIGSAVAAQSLTLGSTTTGAIGSAVAAQALKLDSTTTGAIGSAVAAQSLTLTPTTTTAIGTAVAAPSASSIASAVAAQSLKIGSGTVTVGNPVSAASIGTAVAANPLALQTATTNAIGSAIASQSLTVGSITGGNVSILNTSAIGNDVAVNINTQGVPTLQFGAVIFNGSFGTGVSVGGGYTYTFAQYDLSKYSSLIVNMNSNSANLIRIRWTDANGIIYSDWPYIYGVANQPFYFAQTVRSPTFSIWSPHQLSGTIVLYASNRTMKDDILHASIDGKYSLSQTMVNGTPTLFSMPFPFITNGGQHYLRIGVSTTDKGQFGYVSYDPSGATINNYIVDTGDSHTAASGVGTEKDILIILPPGILTFFWMPYSSNNYSVTVNLIPQSLG